MSGRCQESFFSKLASMPYVRTAIAAYGFTELLTRPSVCVQPLCWQIIWTEHAQFASLPWQPHLYLAQWQPLIKLTQG